MKGENEMECELGTQSERTEPQHHKRMSFVGMLSFSILFKRREWVISEIKGGISGAEPGTNIPDKVGGIGFACSDARDPMHGCVTQQ